MPDREKVIKGLECCTGLGCHHGCEYKSNGYSAMNCRQELEKDALALLKEQEAVEPVPDYNIRYWRCPKCNWLLTSMIDDKCDIPVRRDNYCAKCGRQVKW